MQPIAELLRADRWDFGVSEEGLSVPLQSKDLKWTLVISQCGPTRLSSVALCPVQARRRPDMAGFLNRINVRLDLGCFELDYLHGDIRLRTCLELGQAEPSTELLRPLLLTPPRILDLALPALIRVSEGGSTELPQFPLPEPTRRKSPAQEQLTAFLRAAGQSPTRREEKLILHVVGERARWRCEVAMHGSICRFLSRAPVTIPPRSQTPVLEFLTRTNSSLSLGNFQLERSEIRYRAAFDAGPTGLLPESVLGPLLEVSLTALDHWLPGFLSVMYGKETPLAASKRLAGAAG
ncbi:MAG: hypothetical protein AMXMBFR33_15970 [Candidatus Xenobia bacterium]